MLRKTVMALVLFGMASPAVADEPDADALTKQGLELRREHRDAEALETFRHAYALAPTPRAEAQIALAEQALGRWIDAENDLHAALLHADDPWIARHLAVLEEARLSIESRLGLLEVLVDAAGAELWVNGTDRALLPLRSPIRVEAGSLAIEVRAKGFVAARRITAVEPGGSARETLHLETLASTPTPARSPTVTAPRAKPTRAKESSPTAKRFTAGNTPLRNAGLVVIGAAVLDVVAGAYFGLRTLQIKNERDGHCGTASCDPAGVALDGEARALAIRSTAWFTAGLAAGIGGAALLWVSRSRREDVTVTPALGPNHAGVTLGGSF